MSWKQMCQQSEEQGCPLYFSSVASESTEATEGGGSAPTSLKTRLLSLCFQSLISNFIHGHKYLRLQGFA